MENQNIKPKPIIGFDELFTDGIFVDGTDTPIEYVDELMKQYFSQK